MELCDSGHDEIVFDNGDCPLCQQEVRYGELRDLIETFNAKMLQKFDEARSGGTMVSDLYLEQQIKDLSLGVYS